MKICAIICEFNPFHNGHEYIIKSAKKLSGCDCLLCIMSGSFTQRGDIAVLDKFTRAKHAVWAGADAVIELPAAFSVAPAEIFAKGAIKILGSIPGVCTLIFGCENPEADFPAAAQILNNESKKFGEVLNKSLNAGDSYIKSYAAAFRECGGDGELLSHPNNILGVEYSKAILKSGANISLLPIKRIGQQFNEMEIVGRYPSAQAIRENISSPEVKKCVPPYVYADLKAFSAEKALFGELMQFKLMCAAPETLSKIYGCTEGLENSLSGSCALPLDELIRSVSGKRYTESRIKRILLANLLELYAVDCENYLDNPLYIKPLVIKKDGADRMLAALSKALFPLIFKQRDINLLCKTAKKCLKSDIFADKIRSFIFKEQIKNFTYPQFI